MALVVSIDVLAAGLLIGIVLAKGFEQALPLAASLMMLFPNESQIQLSGLFDLTTQRLVVIVLTVLYIAFGKTRDDNGRKRELPLKYLIAIQIAWMLVSTANSVVVGVSFKTVLSQVFDYFLPFYIFTKTVSRVETIHKILYSLVITMMICSAFGAVEAYSGWSVLSLFPVRLGHFGGGIYGAVTDRGIRVQSTFGHPILFGGALAMAIPLALYLITVATTTSQRIFLWSGVMLMFLNIYKTSSRGPWLALILSVGILAALGRNQIRTHILSVALLALAVLVVRPGVWASISNIYGATQDPDSPAGESYQWRYALYDIANKQLGKDFGRALWGYGPESFFYLGIEDEFQGHMVKYDSCDSSIAALMIETGYVGFLITTALLLTPAFAGFGSFRKLKIPTNCLSLVLLTNMLAFYFLMTNVAIYGWGQQSYMLWIVIAVSMIYPRLQPVEYIADDGVVEDRAETSFQLVQAVSPRLNCEREASTGSRHFRTSLLESGHY